MALIRELNAKLVDWEVRYIIESLSKEMVRLKTVNETSEDEAADAGNDYIEISGLYDRLAAEAVAKFGDQITEF